MVHYFDDRQVFDAGDALFRFVVVHQDHPVRRRFGDILLADDTEEFAVGIDYRDVVLGMRKDPCSHAADPVVRTEQEGVCPEPEIFHRHTEFEPADDAGGVEPGRQNGDFAVFRFLEDQRIDRFVAGDDEQPDPALESAKMDLGTVAGYERQNNKSQLQTQVMYL